jgi:hypothetical protein
VTVLTRSSLLVGVKFVENDGPGLRSRMPKQQALEKGMVPPSFTRSRVSAP